MPLNIDLVQILLHMLNLVILTGGLSLLIYRPIVRFLDERREHFARLEEDHRPLAPNPESTSTDQEIRHD